MQRYSKYKHCNLARKMFEKAFFLMVGAAFETWSCVFPLFIKTATAKLAPPPYSTNPTGQYEYRVQYPYHIQNPNIPGYLNYISVYARYIISGFVSGNDIRLPAASTNYSLVLHKMLYRLLDSVQIDFELDNKHLKSKHIFNMYWYCIKLR